MTAEFAVLRDGRTTAVVQNDFVDSFHRYRLIDCWRTPLLSLPESQRESAESAPRVGGGRGGIRVVPAGPFGEAVVRPYRRGGLVEKVNRRTYFVGSRAFSELVATHRLRRRGAPVPEVLAAVQSRFRAGYLACLVTRRIAKTVPAAEVLGSATAARRAAVLESMGRAIRLLHEAGGVHADLNAYNILVPEEGEGPAFVIDLDRASVLSGPVPERRARANLRRLRRSLLKLGLDEAVAHWDVLESGYDVPPQPPPAA
jgi:3-deoxy-D-manno-octulosonic acid kinase